MNEREFFPLLFDDYANNFFFLLLLYGKKGILEINGNDEEKFSFFFLWEGKYLLYFQYIVDKNENLFFFLLFLFSEDQYQKASWVEMMVFTGLLMFKSINLMLMGFIVVCKGFRRSVAYLRGFWFPFRWGFVERLVCFFSSGKLSSIFPEAHFIIFYVDIKVMFLLSTS